LDLPILDRQAVISRPPVERRRRIVHTGRGENFQRFRMPSTPADRARKSASRRKPCACSWTAWICRPGLERLLEHGEVELDSNRVVNSLRPGAVSLKNWLWFGSEAEGRRNAVVLALVANGRLHGVNAFAYFKNVRQRCRG
jgi:hypothetical protein